MAELVLLPAFVMGAIVGLIELFFVHADEVGMGWLLHGLHALPFTVLFVFVSMNVSFIYGFLPGGLTENLWVDLGIRAAVFIIGMIKIAAAAAIAGRVGERIHHTIIIGALIFASPYIWMFIGPFVPLPAWL